MAENYSRSRKKQFSENSVQSISKIKYNPDLRLGSHNFFKEGIFSQLLHISNLVSSNLI